MGSAELTRIGPVRGQIICGVLYPRCFANEAGGPIAEAIFKGGAIFRQANNARVRQFGAASGWGQIRGRLLGNDDGEPMIYCFSTCVDSFRTIPVLQHDPDRLEDLDTTQEDHAADDRQYACNWRPRMKPTPKKPGPISNRCWPTFKEPIDERMPWSRNEPNDGSYAKHRSASKKSSLGGIALGCAGGEGPQCAQLHMSPQQPSPRRWRLFR